VRLPPSRVCVRDDTSTCMLSQIAVSKGCARLVWQVLDWNTKAIDFYERHGGQCLKEWLPMRMNQHTFTRFAGGGENEQQT